MPVSTTEDAAGSDTAAWRHSAGPASAGEVCKTPLVHELATQPRAGTWPGECESRESNMASVIEIDVARGADSLSPVQGSRLRPRKPMRVSVNRTRAATTIEGPVGVSRCADE